MEIERIVERIYEICRKTHRSSLLPETIMELLGNSKTIFGADERNSQMFREIILTEKPWGIYAKLAEEYNIKQQRILILKDKMIEKMYLSDAKTRFSKLKTNEEKVEASIDTLGLKNEIIDALKKLECEKVKDIYGLDDEDLRRLDKRSILERLNTLGIQKPIIKNKCIRDIKTIDMGPSTYGELFKNGIKTNYELVERINEIIENPNINPTKKQKILDLYEIIVKEISDDDIRKCK